MALKEVKYPKKREALLKHYHGEDWTLEDQEQFVRERNTRHCRKSRDNHREAYTTYQKEYQRKYRERNKYHYGFVLWNKNHPDEPMTEDEYVAYRKQKERKRKMQEKKNGL